jgi:2-oxo-4-hydroxy-4-carboxy--5-ureidoimidazoline (OHCU) decarboxylase
MNFDFSKLEDGAFSALHTEKAYALDIRDYKQKTGDTLAKAIEQAVKDTQSVVVRAYPDRLVLTQKQYNLLARKPEMHTIEAEGQDYYLYRTKYNIMELEIK